MRIVLLPTLSLARADAASDGEHRLAAESADDGDDRVMGKYVVIATGALAGLCLLLILKHALSSTPPKKASLPSVRFRTSQGEGDTANKTLTNTTFQITLHRRSFSDSFGFQGTWDRKDGDPHEVSNLF